MEVVSQKISRRARDLPKTIQDEASELERNSCKENHLAMALAAKQHLAGRNVDSYISETVRGDHFVVVKGAPLDPSRPTDTLSQLAAQLRREDVSLNFYTSFYLSGMAGFTPLAFDALDAGMSLSASWKELGHDGQFSTDMDHELRHLEQQQIRMEARRDPEKENPFPDIRVKYEKESACLSPWIAKHYNGKFGHTIDEHDAYLHQALKEFDRATQSGEEGFLKALDYSVRSALFALSDADALDFERASLSFDEPSQENLRGDLRLDTDAVTIWVDSRDISQDHLQRGLRQTVGQLRRGFESAKELGLKAFGQLSEGDQKGLWKEQLQSLGWLPTEVARTNSL